MQKRVPLPKDLPGALARAQREHLAWDPYPCTIEEVTEKTVDVFFTGGTLEHEVNVRDLERMLAGLRWFKACRTQAWYPDALYVTLDREIAF